MPFRHRQDKGVTLAQTALAWLLARRRWIVPIGGTTKYPRLEENVGGAAVELTTGELDRIDRAAAGITIVGACYSDEHERRTNL